MSAQIISLALYRRRQGGSFRPIEPGDSDRDFALRRATAAADLIAAGDLDGAAERFAWLARYALRIKAREERHKRRNAARRAARAARRSCPPDDR